MPSRIGVESGGYVKRMDEIYSGDERLLMDKKVVFKDVKGEEDDEEKMKFLKINSFVNNNNNNKCHSDESSSSIGKNSDLSENSSMEKSGDGEEVQSSYKGPLDAMEALEEVLPIRRGISRFYNGKSKSFASLADASSSSSIKDLGKAENAYMRKRRNLLARNLTWDKTRSSPLRGSNSGGISKRVTSSSRTTLALAVAMKSSESEKQSRECSSGGLSLPVSNSFYPWRSFSLADLQQCVSVAPTGSNLGHLAKEASS